MIRPALFHVRLTWLESRHRRAVREAIDDALFEDLGDDDLADFDDLDDDIRDSIIGQTHEWYNRLTEYCDAGKIASDDIKADATGKANA